MEPHDERLELGAYLLGALDPAGRQAMDRHLASCAQCRDELASLSSVRPLLDRLDANDIEATTSPLVPDRLVESISRARRRERRTLRVWQSVAAAACIAVAVSFLVMDEPAPDVGMPLTLSEVTDDATGADGTVVARSVGWGTALDVQLTSLPTRSAYQVWVVATDGRREIAGTWGPTPVGRANLAGASAIASDEIERIEVTDRIGILLMSFVPSRGQT